MDKTLYLIFALVVSVASNGILGSNLVQSRNALENEKKLHAATIEKAGIAEGLCKTNQEQTERTIKGLNAQVEGLSASMEQYQADEAERMAILATNTCIQRTDEDKGKVVDENTRRKAADFLNAW